VLDSPTPAWRLPEPRASTIVAQTFTQNHKGEMKDAQLRAVCIVSTCVRIRSNGPE
jgi:hypothetical protein